MMRIACPSPAEFCMRITLAVWPIKGARSDHYVGNVGGLRGPQATFRVARGVEAEGIKRGLRVCGAPRSDVLSGRDLTLSYGA